MKVRREKSILYSLGTGPQSPIVQEERQDVYGEKSKVDVGLLFK